MTETSVSYDNFLEFLAGQPHESDGKPDIVHRSVKVPASWEQLGSVYDDGLGATVISHSSGRGITLGFYPYNGCDIYRDRETNDILLSYVELGGHGAARLSFPVTKRTPFLLEPVSTDIQVVPDKIDEFYAIMRERGLTKADMSAQAKHYEVRYQIIEPLPEDRLTFLRFQSADAPKGL